MQASLACDVADAHAMFKLTRNFETADADADDGSLLCVVGAGVQLVRLVTRRST